MVYSPHPPYEILAESRRRFCDDAADAQVQPVLGSDREQWEFRRDDRQIAFFSLSLRERAGVRGCSANERFSSLEAPLTLTLSRRERGPRSLSAFWNFLALSDWIFATTKQTHAIALQTLAELIFRFLTSKT